RAPGAAPGWCRGGWSFHALLLYQRQPMLASLHGIDPVGLSLRQTTEQVVCSWVDAASPVQRAQRSQELAAQLAHDVIGLLVQGARAPFDGIGQRAETSILFQLPIHQRLVVDALTEREGDKTKQSASRISVVPVVLVVGGHSIYS